MFKKFWSLPFFRSISIYEPPHDKTNNMTDQSLQTSLIRVFAVRSKYPSFLHADSEDSDQIGRMPSLIWIFTGRACHCVGFVIYIVICQKTSLPDIQALRTNTLIHFFFFIWILRPFKIIWLILSRVNRLVGRKWEIPEKNHLTTRKQNLVCLTCDPS